MEKTQEEQPSLLTSFKSFVKRDVVLSVALGFIIVMVAVKLMYRVAQVTPILLPPRVQAVPSAPELPPQLASNPEIEGYIDELYRLTKL